MKKQSKKNFLQDFSKQRYLEYLKMLPDIKSEKTQIYTTLIFTFVALIVFGIFAINPTLTTITQLHTELAERKYVEQQLSQKITNLGSLQDQYSKFGTDLDYITRAVPKNPDTTSITGQLQALGEQAGIQITTLQINTAQLSPSKKPAEMLKSHPISFVVTGTGTFTQIDRFLRELIAFQRITTIEIIGIDRDITGNLRLNVKGSVYFLM